MAVVSMDDLPYLEISDNAPGPETSMSRKEEQQRVRRLLETLNPTDRAAVMMYYWYDFSYEEIGEALSLSLSAVKSRLHRARLAMAQEWIDQQPQPGTVERTRHDTAQSPAF
jgi:RNA polymerase sigma-70 factor (ECF subfamily)